MQPCRDAVAANLEQLLEGLKSDTQSYWDVRFDYLAFHNSNQSDGGLIHHCSSVRLPSCPLVDAIYKNQGNSQEYSQFFTKDVNEFKKALMKEPLEGEEMQQAVQGYYDVLYQANPASVGGAMPYDDFYYFP